MGNCIKFFVLVASHQIYFPDLNIAAAFLLLDQLAQPLKVLNAFLVQILGVEEQIGLFRLIFDQYPARRCRILDGVVLFDAQFTRPVGLEGVRGARCRLQC